MVDPRVHGDDMIRGHAQRVLTDTAWVAFRRHPHVQSDEYSAKI